jgi:dUTP pyrophosphatase
MKIRVKYFEGATRLKKIQKGNWIDVYANKDVFVPVGERAMIPLGLL